ncbi:hypothetical protein ACFLQ0_04570, partial [Nitrospinota bacterium]
MLGRYLLQDARLERIGERGRFDGDRSEAAKHLGQLEVLRTGLPVAQMAANERPEGLLPTMSGMAQRVRSPNAAWFRGLSDLAERHPILRTPIF